MSESLVPTGTACRTYQPCLVSLSRRAPTASSPLAPDPKGPLVGLRGGHPADQGANPGPLLHLRP